MDLSWAEEDSVQAFTLNSNLPSAPSSELMEMTTSFLYVGDVKSSQNSALYVQFECIANVCDVSIEESCEPKSGTSKEKEKTSTPSIIVNLMRRKESFPRPKSSTNQTANMLQYNAFITNLKKKNFFGGSCRFVFWFSLEHHLW